MCALLAGDLRGGGGSKWIWRNPVCWWGPPGGGVWPWSSCTLCTPPSWAPGPPSERFCRRRKRETERGRDTEGRDDLQQILFLSLQALCNFVEKCCYINKVYYYHHYKGLCGAPQRTFGLLAFQTPNIITHEFRPSPPTFRYADRNLPQTLWWSSSVSSSLLGPSTAVPAALAWRMTRNINSQIWDYLKSHLFVSTLYKWRGTICILTH